MSVRRKDGMDERQESGKAAPDFHTSAYADLIDDMHHTFYFLNVTMSLFIHHALLLEGGTLMGVEASVIDRLAGDNDEKRAALAEQDETLMREWNTFMEHSSRERYNRMLMEISLSRNVDAFNYYMVRMLNYVFEQNRDSLSEKDRKALMGKSDDERKEVLEKIVDTQLRLGLRNVFQYLISNMGFIFDINTDTFSKSDEYIAVRNLCVHSAGRVNRRFLTRTKRTDLNIGDEYPLPVQYVIDGYLTFSAMVRYLDAEIIRQFNLFAGDREARCSIVDTSI